MALLSVLKGCAVLWRTRKDRESRLVIALGFTFPRAIEWLEDVDRAIAEQKVDVEKDRSLFSNIIDLGIHKISEKIKNTPDDVQVDPDNAIVASIGKMEKSLVLMLEALTPPKDKAGKELDNEILNYVSQLQKLKNTIIERDCLLSPIVSEPFSDRKGFLLAIRDD